MKFKFFLMMTIMLALAGCFFTAVTPIAPTAHPPYRTGALLGGPVIQAPTYRTYFASRLKASSAPMSAFIAAANIMPPMLQQASDCGPCSMTAIAYPITHQLFSARATYVWSRQHASPSSWTADSGTFAFANIWTAQNLGQPRTSVWPYPGDINQVPTAAATADAAAFKLVPLLTPTLADIKAAIAAGHPVGIYVNATTDWYSPVRTADGSYEVKTPIASSTRIGGHFPTVIGYDDNRKMLDGSTGGAEILNSWGANWAGDGEAWISYAGWIVTNGNAGSDFTLVSASPPPPPPPPPPPLPPAPTKVPLVRSISAAYTGYPAPLKAGKTAVLSWSIDPTTGPATVTVRAAAPASTIYSGPLLTGSVNIAPTKSTQYQLTAVNVVGSSVKSWIVVVSP